MDLLEIVLFYALSRSKKIRVFCLTFSNVTQREMMCHPTENRRRIFSSGQEEKLKTDEDYQLIDNLCTDVKPHIGKKKSRLDHVWA